MKEEYLPSLLPTVRRPSRYINGEINSVKKDLSKVALKFCLAFPDTYEVGISHLGVQILYSILNNHPDIACERVYTPWIDMEERLKNKGLPLSSLESHLPLKEFDCIGFSLQYELSYTNCLTILDLAGIPLLAKDRGDSYPLIIGGGPLAYNPEPVADFFDAFCLGDGEELILDIALTLIEAKRKGMNKRDTLLELSRIEGVYIPSFFEVSYGSDGKVEAIEGLVKGYEVKRRIVKDLEETFFPTRPIVPYTQAVHDRLTIEIARGCTRGCRFCHAGMVCRPVRERSPEKIMELIRDGLRSTGYDEVSLLSLSTGDYTCINDLVVRLAKWLNEERIALSFPSLRVGALNPLLVDEVRRVRKTGFTIAPEAGTARLRAVINKVIDEDELIREAELLFEAGWRSIKLYFMIGLPTEKDEDIEGIVNLSKRVSRAAKDRRATVKVSVSTFVPKPHTPFQWVSMIRVEEISNKQSYLKKRLKKGFELKTHDAGMSLLEGVFARGDRRLSRVILKAYERGCRFDGWSERFRFDMWEDAFKEVGLDMAFYAYRERGKDELFPWGHLGSFISKEFLWREYERALKGEVSEDCKVGRCEGCGVCDFKEIKNVVVTEIKGLGSEVGGRRKAIFSPVKSRLRINFSKTGQMRFLSHLEMVNLFYRALRRAGFPLLYSQGFHPLPKVSFGYPLPVGIESLDEYMDVEIEGLPQLKSLFERLKKEMPEGIMLLDIKPIPLRSPSITASIRGATYNLLLEEWVVRKVGGIDELKERIMGMEGNIGGYIKDLSLADSNITLTLIEREGRHLKVYDALMGILGLEQEDLPLLKVVKVKSVF